VKEKDNDLVVSQIANATPPGFGKLRLKTCIRRDKERRLLKGEWADGSVLPEAAAQNPDIDTIIPALT